MSRAKPAPAPAPPPSKADRVRATAEKLRNLPKFAAAAERQERTTAETALFFVAAAILDALADLSEPDK